MKITVRAALPNDAPEVVEILNASWKVAYKGMMPQEYLDRLEEHDRTPRLRKDLSDGKLRELLLLEDGVRAGTVGYAKSRDQSLPDWGEIICIYVHPDYFHKGYGAKLLRSAVENLRGEGYSNIFLWVLADNKNAQDFYLHMGFQKTDDICHSKIMGEQLTEIRYILRQK